MIPLKILDFTGVVAAATGGLLAEVALQQAFEGRGMADKRVTDASENDT